MANRTLAPCGALSFRMMFAGTVALVCACSTSQAAPPPLMPQTVSRRTQPGGGTMEIRNDPSAGAFHVPAPVDAVWEVLAEVYERLGIPIGLSDPSQRLLGNQRYRGRAMEGRPLSQFMDCGRGMGPPYADQYSVTMFVVTHLTHADGTIVTTTVDGSAKPRDVRGDTVACSSKGRIERRVAELVAELLGEGAARDTTEYAAS